MPATPDGLVSPDTPSVSLPLTEAPTPPPPPLPGPLLTSPPLLPPLPLPPFLLYGNMSLMFYETPIRYCRGTEHEILGHLSLPYISERLPNVGIGHSPI